MNKKINYKSIISTIKLLIDDHIIDLRYSENDSNTINNIVQTFIQGFLMKKKDIKINKISIFNVILGEIFTYDTSNINFSKIQKIIYRN